MTHSLIADLLRVAKEILNGHLVGVQGLLHELKSDRMIAAPRDRRRTSECQESEVVRLECAAAIQSNRKIRDGSTRETGAPENRIASAVIARTIAAAVTRISGSDARTS